MAARDHLSQQKTGTKGMLIHAKNKLKIYPGNVPSMYEKIDAK
jgi:hypothetical protein